MKTRSMVISKLDFDAVGKISIKLDDGRILIVPLKYFPELKKLPKEKRKKYTIVDDRTVLFMYSDNVYHLEDFLGLESTWRER
ncbi:MAG: DUF2442 domain-containing protein [Candidatus Kapaibacterium sp.]